MSRRSLLPTLRWAAGGVLVAGLLSRALGLLREMLIANAFGVSAELDALYLGLSLPLALVVGAGGGLSRAVVPVAATLADSRFAGLMRAGTARLVGVLAPLSVVLAVTCVIWAPLLAIGQTELPRGTLILSAALGSLAMLGGSLSGFYAGLVNARGKHVTASSNALVYNGVVCLCVAFFHGKLGILSLLVGIFLAEWLQLAVHWPVLQAIVRRVRPQGDPADIGMVQTLFWPAAALGITTGLNLLVDRAFATMTQAGGVAALTYADKLVTLPAGLLGAALAAPLFTRLSRFHQADRRKEFRATLLLGVRILLLAGTPAAVVLAGAAEPTIGLILQRGRFTLEGVELCGIAMRGYAPGVPFRAMTVLLLGAGLATRRPWWIVWAVLATALLNGVLDWVLVQSMGLLGIALATSIVGLVRSAVMVAIVAPGLLGAAELWRSLGRVTAYGVALSLPLAGLHLVPGLMTSEAVGVRLLAVALACATACVVTAVLWKPLLKKEWSSLWTLRRQVAEAAAGLQREGATKK
ncbi:MAG: polysaccharide biosynthesis C-terminal domain-containing protein [Candidatus Sumerlaeia bacterium]|nr:polysaccharide biosynthesis C-terminal domain-containing protein [Candidatus Sumerlaeia bacterium]